MCDTAQTEKGRVEGVDGELHHYHQKNRQFLEAQSTSTAFCGYMIRLPPKAPLKVALVLAALCLKSENQVRLSQSDHEPSLGRRETIFQPWSEIRHLTAVNLKYASAQHTRLLYHELLPQRKRLMTT
jgi:hypothetical protein